jgi:hypothetical protein
VTKAIETRSVIEAVQSAEQVPAIRVGDRLLTGPDAPERAAA